MNHRVYEPSLTKHELIEADDASNDIAPPAVFVELAPKLHGSTARLHSERLSTRPGAQRTVFYVDENPKASRLLTFVLEGCGYKVAIAGNSSEALVGMKRTSFDLVLLACRRPQTICSQLVPEIRQLRPGIPVVLISGYTLLTPVELIAVNAHVGKGATLDDLLLKIRALIGHATQLKGASGYCRRL